MELLVLIVFIGIVSIVVVGLVRGQRLRAAGFTVSREPPPIVDEHEFHPVDTVTVKGGARGGNRSVSSPLATMRADRSVVRITAPLIDTQIRRADVTRVVVVTGRPLSGLMFRSAEGIYDGVVFLTRTVANVAADLRNLGWPVDGVGSSWERAPDEGAGRA